MQQQYVLGLFPHYSWDRNQLLLLALWESADFSFFFLFVKNEGKVIEYLFLITVVIIAPFKTYSKKA